MTIRSDHVAGAFFIVFGIIVFALSGDLPFGTISAPGAGMMPKLAAGLMMAFAVAIVAQGGRSRPLAEIDWSDLRHAVPVVIVTFAAIAAYQPFGFLITMGALVFLLLAVVEFPTRLLDAA